MSIGDAVELRRLAREYKTFPTNNADTTFYKTDHEHIGEAEPMTSDDICEHRYLVPDTTKTYVVFNVFVHT